MKKTVFFVLLFTLFSAVSYAMQADPTLDQASADLVMAGVALAKVAGPGVAYIKMGHPGQYQDAAWVSLGSFVLWQGAKRSFTKMTGHAPVIPQLENNEKGFWKKAANTGITLTNKAIDTVVGPIVLSILVQKGMNALDVPNGEAAA